MHVLPQFKGYTVDFRLREFHRMVYGAEGEVVFVPFESVEGQRLCAELIALVEVNERVNDDAMRTLWPEGAPSAGDILQVWGQIVSLRSAHEPLF